MVSNATATGYNSESFITLVNSTSLVARTQDTMPISKKFIGAVEDEWQLYRLALVLTQIILCLWTLAQWFSWRLYHRFTYRFWGLLNCLLCSIPPILCRVIGAGHSLRDQGFRPWHFGASVSAAFTKRNHPHVSLETPKGFACPRFVDWRSQTLHCLPAYEQRKCRWRHAVWLAWWHGRRRSPMYSESGSQRFKVCLDMIYKYICWLYFSQATCMSMDLYIGISRRQIF